MSDNKTVKVIAYDIGTTGVKTCLFSLGEKIIPLDSTSGDYDLYVFEDGGAEQEPQQWWDAMCVTTKELMAKNGLSGSDISGISFCAQMQALVLVDKEGEPLRRAMSYMDSRGRKEMAEGIQKGFCVAGLNGRKLFKSLKITGAVSGSVKDPLWKYKWVEAHEPDIFAKADKWLDVKDYLAGRATGNFVMSRDSAFSTMLYDIHNRSFSREMCKMMGVNMKHLPELCNSTDVVGTLRERQAEELGLVSGIPVFSGGGDASLIGVGAGAASPGQTHVYMGTSGWVSTVTKEHKKDLSNMMSALVGASPDSYNYFAELETAGKCLEWVKNHLALDETEMFLEKKPAWESPESVATGLYDYMIQSIKDVPAGSNGVIFTPWLHGNRCPFEAPDARGMFFNMGIETGKRDLIHAVIEGVCYHLRWQLEASEKKVKASETIRLVGGGALAPLTCQILADMLGRKIEVVDSPQNAGSVGAAAVMATGLGIAASLEACAEMIEVAGVYMPNPENKRIYDERFPVFKSLYTQNKEAFRKMNGKK